MRASTTTVTLSTNICYLIRSVRAIRRRRKMIWECITYFGQEIFVGLLECNVEVYFEVLNDECSQDF
jgi:hypothetical protein